MSELRVGSPSDPRVVVRLKLTQGALGICDIYRDGRWTSRGHWTPFTSWVYDKYSRETVPADLSPALALAFHALVGKRGNAHVARDQAQARAA